MTHHRLSGVPVRTLLLFCAIGAALIATLPTAALAQKGKNGPVAPAAPAGQESLQGLDRTSAVAADSAFDAQRATAAKKGTARVIVGLQTQYRAEGSLSAAARKDQRAGIAQERGSLLKALKGTKYGTVS